MQRYFAKDKSDNYLILDSGDIHHIKNVMRMSDNDEIECVYNNKLYICCIESLKEEKFLIVSDLEDNNELNVDITVAVSLVKEQKMDLILQKLTELGVKRIIPVSMERSVVKLDRERFAKKKKRWLSICKEASEQSKRNFIPEITDIMSVKELNNIDCDIKIVCSVKEKYNLVNNYLQQISNCATIIFVIGSEGGITDNEERLLNSYGYTSVSLGNLVFRVETAAIYVASIINYCSMR